MDWLNLLFPKKCINCGRWGSYVCDKCQVGLWEEEQICPVCTGLSRYGLPHKYCHQPYSLAGLTCLWAYEGIARKLITRAKYKFFYDYLREFSITNFSVNAGSSSAGQFSNRPEFSYFLKFLETKPVVVPVPLYSSREKWRGFNQAKVIADLVARSWTLNTRDLLIKTRETGQQVGRTRQERVDAQKNAFQISNSKFQIPPEVLLVDDVWTTGATLSECCRVLKKAGAKQVWGLVLAR